MIAKPKTVPELRFPGFEEEWNRTKLANTVSSIDSGWSPQCSDEPAESSDWGILKTTSVVWNGYNEGANKRLLSGSEPREQIEVKVCDILITRAGPSERVGVVAHVDRTRPMLMLSDKIIRLRCNDLVDSRFIARCVSSKESQDHLLGRKSGLAKSQTNISQNDLKSVPLTIPTLPEQRKIADFLTAVDGRIGQLSQKKALLEDYKKGVMQQLFTQALRFKDDHGNDFPEWEEKNFTDVLGTTSPRGFQIQSSEILPKGRFKVVDQGKALIAGYCDDSEKVMRTCPVIVYGDHTTIIKYVDFEFVVGADGTQILVSKDQRNDLKYLYYNLAQNNVTQEGYKRHFSILKGILMQIPSPAEQTKIANFLTALDRKIESVAQQIRHTQAFKKGLLQQMFV